MNSRRTTVLFRVIGGAALVCAACGRHPEATPPSPRTEEGAPPPAAAATPTPEEDAQAFIRRFQAAWDGNAPDAFSEVLADDLSSDLGNKTELLEAIKEAVEKGHHVDFSKAAATRELNGIRISPIVATGGEETRLDMLIGPVDGHLRLKELTLISEPATETSDGELPIGTLPDAADPNEAFRPVEDSQY